MAANESIARVETLSKRFVVNKDKSLRGRLLALGASRRHREDFWALRDVDLDVQAGTTLGIVGHNGSGKSTLLKCIGGIIEPTSGTVWRRGRLAALLELGAGFHPDLTGRENVFLNAAILGLTRRETARHFDAMVEFSGVADFIDTQVKFYSSGMFVRLAFAVAVHADPDLLLVDEVLAVGDEPFQRKCLAKIAEFQKEGRSILLVSHRQDQVRLLCDRVAVLDRGGLIHDGDPATGLAILKAQYEARTPGDGVTPEVAGDKTHTIASVETRVTHSAGEPRLTVAVVVDVVKARTAWDLVLTLRTASGIVLVAIKCSDCGATPPTTMGRHAVTMTFEQVPLAAGDYVLDAAVVGTGGAVIDRVSGAGAFDLAHHSPGEGLLRLSAMVEYDSPTDP